MEWLQNRLLYIELVVVTVVGGGEDVENPEMSCRDAGLWLSTGLWKAREGNVERWETVILSTADVKN